MIPLSYRPWLMASAIVAVIAVTLTLYLHHSGTLSYQILAWQRGLHRQLVSAITDFQVLPPAAAWWGMLSISFGYGVFHAAGPGHGKAVIATYLTTHRQSVWRGISMAFASSLLQGLTAIAMIVILVHGLGWVTRQAMSSVAHVEMASFSLVALLGGWLVWRSGRKLQRRSHHDDHADCCHHHTPSPSGDRKTISLAILSIGIRPCTGAVLLLGAASLLGNFLIGIAAVLAMSLGTAIVVAAIAVLSVTCRDWVSRYAGHHGASPWLSLVPSWAGLIGGVMIFAIGVSLVIAGLSDPVNTTGGRPF